MTNHAENISGQPENQRGRIRSFLSRMGDKVLGPRLTIEEAQGLGLTPYAFLRPGQIYIEPDVIEPERPQRPRTDEEIAAMIEDIRQIQATIAAAPNPGETLAARLQETIADGSMERALAEDDPPCR